MKKSSVEKQASLFIALGAWGLAANVLALIVISLMNGWSQVSGLVIVSTISISTLFLGIGLFHVCVESKKMINRSLR